MTKQFQEYLGEAVGTFILVFFGCASVAAAILFDAFGNLFEIALFWGIGVALAIFTVRNYCPAHLNPAVSLAMSIAGKHPWKKLPAFFLAQLTGAFLAGLSIYFIFGSAILEYETANGMLRGSEDSRLIAAIFGEFFPNPGLAKQISVSWYQAMTLEAAGTFILVFVIFRLTDKKEQNDNLIPVMIGLTVTLIICVVAPFTQAGLNPARDFGPRLVAWMWGWGDVAFPSEPLSFLTVYILGPLSGGALAAVAVRSFRSKS